MLKLTMVLAVSCLALSCGGSSSKKNSPEGNKSSDSIESSDGKGIEQGNGGRVEGRDSGNRSGAEFFARCEHKRSNVRADQDISDEWFRKLNWGAEPKKGDFCYIVVGNDLAAMKQECLDSGEKTSHIRQTGHVNKAYFHETDKQESCNADLFSSGFNPDPTVTVSQCKCSFEKGANVYFAVGRDQYCEAAFSQCKTF